MFDCFGKVLCINCGAPTKLQVTESAPAGQYKSVFQCTDCGNERTLLFNRPVAKPQNGRRVTSNQ